ncbi:MULTISPECIES: phosphatidylglycerophosphatase A [unclassified Gilliamella]|uniref:phosphatidylglycerophosphatase A family protein n=1 Tax=unclassified Gilliamella TaxID=2685620 RepID=UPI001C6A5B09|nr:MULTISPECIES: phosphatidylglycerophosphatase A [unclassified Gilliamella]MCX8601654.1 phosphatidylglycerophosphatase A [Gilliamella sp. B3722]MCX8608576.1 phosphatidylglycerophosphatase A [Gilliamella sp. B3771]MCX8610917.1 phosphatidylglycerophosphatase A [Gilliamella sp. B3891]MCX8613385.1 phosphatidylglycerophosphatase A [Gilliamella sp. B3773]MCX8615228.1 phosphatidylglycerophosphatase A [Gilliamella sp. B3770]
MTKQARNKDFKKYLKLTNPIHFLAVGLGSGLSPIMPGTMGSLMAIPLWLLFWGLQPALYWVFILVTFVFGCYICQKTSDDTHTHDSGHIVWDEFVGMWITLYFIPQFSILWVTIAFVAFRLFDMAKPWPIRWFDKRVPGGFGIMVDDVIAAIFSSITVWVLAYLLAS